MARNTKVYGSPYRYHKTAEAGKKKVADLLSKIKPKKSFTYDVDKASRVAKRIGEYRGFKHNKPRYDPLTKEIEIAAKLPGLAKTPGAVKKLASPMGIYRSMTREMSTDEYLERKSRIKEMNPEAIFPDDTQLYRTITEMLDHGMTPVFDDKGNSVDELARDLSRFAQRWDSFEQVEKLMSYYEQQQGDIYEVWKNSDQLQKKYGEYKDFGQDFWTIFRQINKKHEYESDSVLMVMTSGDSDYLYDAISDKDTTIEKIQKMVELHQGEFERMRPGRISENAEIRQASDAARKRGRPKKVDTLAPGEHVGDNVRLEDLSAADFGVVVGDYIKATETDALRDMMETVGAIRKANVVWKKIEKDPNLIPTLSMLGRDHLKRKHPDNKPFKGRRFEEYQAYKLVVDELGDDTNFDVPNNRFKVVSKLFDIVQGGTDNGGTNL